MPQQAFLPASRAAENTLRRNPTSASQRFTKDLRRSQRKVQQHTPIHVGGRVSGTHLVSATPTFTSALAIHAARHEHGVVSHGPAFVDRVRSHRETEAVAVRLRLYPCSAGTSHAPLLIDRFPAVLSAPRDWPDLGPHDCGLSRWCLLEVRAGAIYQVDQTPNAVTFRNGTRLPIEQQELTPLQPGDRLSIDESEFIVSYEQVTRPSTDLQQRRKLRRIDHPQLRETMAAGR